MSPFAELPSRATACFIDGLIQLTLALVVLMGAAIMGFLSSKSIFFIVSVGILLAIIIFFGYFMILEAIWAGQTPGKWLTSLRVVRLDGSRIGPGEAVVRNLLRLVDGLIICYGVGIVAVFCSPCRQRLGDMAAGTVVVYEGKRCLEPENLDQLKEVYRHRREALFPAARADFDRRLTALQEGTVRKNEA